MGIRRTAEFDRNLKVTRDLFIDHYPLIIFIFSSFNFHFLVAVPIILLAVV